MEDSERLCSSNDLTFVCNSCNESDMGENYYFFFVKEMFRCKMSL